ncbi:Hypothetical Protein FCC1311_054392 [Hondaea fermentalgiana]|uniref:Uncharacterized protein n=1 Tax=Hondaea fermentalgiana TaxID=2315210 RepID=A0A2R5GE57_9STRA|nr:Hypothetical Protein FCC1311_054392 [Hondaea fermentalgiana]|eukprot:GBG29217.1 Hypothetical Protein FCC1311_054392 [Hondaea fermentalgiana]
MLVDAGADMTVRNRAGLNPIESALALHLYNEMAIFLEQFSTWDLACCIARRFFLDYFSGDPVYHHYKNLNYEHAIFMAYAVVMHPSALRGGLQLRMKLRQFFNKERTMNNLERFFHDIRGDHRYDTSKNGRFDFHTPLKQKHKDEPLKKQLLQAHKNLEAKEALRRGGSQKALNNGATGNGGGGDDDDDDDDDDERDELDLIPFGMFVEFKRSKLRRWHTKAQAWDFSKCPDRIARFAFQGRLSSKEISEKLTQGRQAFADWRDANRQTLRDDEDRRLRQVADAVRLRKLRKDRAAKLEQQRIEEERIRQERAKKGLDKMDPDAKVVLSGAEVIYDIDEGQTSATYTICLGTRPVAPVLVKLSVISAPTATAPDAVDDGTKDQTQFLIRPTLVTFTPKNWEEPRQVEVWPKDDDALVRMKRKVTQGPAGVCDHKLVHVIPSTTDWSYKHPDLVWEPVQDPVLSVV